MLWTALAQARIVELEGLVETTRSAVSSLEARLVEADTRNTRLVEETQLHRQCHSDAVEQAGVALNKADDAAARCHTAQQEAAAAKAQVWSLVSHDLHRCASSYIRFPLPPVSYSHTVFVATSAVHA